MCRYLYLILLCGTIVSVFSSREQEPVESEDNDFILETSQGKLIGSVLKSRSGRDFYSFKGIKYGFAQRFQRSKATEKWVDIRNAKVYGESCVQMFGTPQPTGSEDCLFINVHTPNVKPDNKLDTIVWIHGGGLQFGSSNEYAPDYFMDENVILVTFNYRLGVLGFLSTGDEIVPGNNGLKDQSLALQWVKDNIHSFGGSADKVTIFGESAGASSVNFHLLSKLSEGLFQRAIAFSGSSLNPWTVQINPEKNAREIGKKLNCSTDDMQQIVNCLIEQDLESLLTAQISFWEWFLYPMCTFSVVVESKSNKESFLTDTPYNLMKSGSIINKVPYLTGFTKDEGVFFTAAVVYNDDLTKELNEDFKRLGPIALMYGDSESKDLISEKIVNFYAQGKSLDKSTWKNYNELFGDRWINNGVINAANILSKHIKVYPYIFSYQGDASVVTQFWGVPGLHGVSHADEIPYLFKQFAGMPEILNGDSEPENLSRNFIKSIVQFSKTGIAKPWGKETVWNEINPEQKTAFWFNINKETSLENLNEKFGSRLDLWTNLLPEDELISWRSKDSSSRSKSEL